MTEKPQRPTLHLKFGARPAIQPSAAAGPVAAASAATKEREWKCKPCGRVFQVAPTAPDEEAVRCPACNAKLGLARDFRAPPGVPTKLRARPLDGA